MTYKGHEISKTETVHANSGRPLYKIEGRFSKDAAHRPFISSVRDAKAWINEQLAVDWFPGTEGTHFAGLPLADPS